jgi:hypothetical protein
MQPNKIKDVRENKRIHKKAKHKPVFFSTLLIQYYLIRFKKKNFDLNVHAKNCR